MPVVQSLDVEKDSLKPRDGVQGMLELEVPYLNAIGPTNKLVGNQDIFRYLQGTTHYLTYSGNFREI
jgi:hypothetical protein